MYAFTAVYMRKRYYNILSRVDKTVDPETTRDSLYFALWNENTLHISFHLLIHLLLFYPLQFFSKWKTWTIPA